MKRLLIAGCSREIEAELLRLGEGLYELSTSHDAEEVLHILMTDPPDAMIIDLFISGMDGVSLLKEAGKYGPLPDTIAMTDYITDYVVFPLEELGVHMLHNMSVKPVTLIAQITHITGITTATFNAVKDPDLRRQLDAFAYIEYPIKNHWKEVIFRDKPIAYDPATEISPNYVVFYEDDIYDPAADHFVDKVPQKGHLTNIYKKPDGV